MSSLSHRPPQEGGQTPLEHCPLDLEVARLLERTGRIHDQEVGEQELGQRMVPVLVGRPVDLSVQAVVERRDWRSIARDTRRRSAWRG